MRFIRFILAIVALVAFATWARAELKPAALFCDHAVLQAGTPIAIWGWADAGQDVQVEIGANRTVSKANADGKWLIKLPAMEAGAKPVEVTIRAGDEQKIIHDVLIGEVWLGSGQSNMAMAVQRTSDAEQTIAEADTPAIRLFTVTRAATTKPAADVEGHWVLCSPRTVANFSAVLYHFGRTVHGRLDVPVGLIHSSWGGTPIQAWMPREAFAGGDEEIAAQRKRVRERYPETTMPSTKRALRSAPHLEPTKLFNGMIAPVIPYAIRGVTWYQGENNVHQGDVSDYAKMMQAMVQTWRSQWTSASSVEPGQGDSPFLFVQLAPYGKYQAPWEALPQMWEQQAAALKLIKNSGMAATGDVGDEADIHPKQKRVVGERLAAIALAKTYALNDVKWEAPMFKSVLREGSRVRVSFTVPVHLVAVKDASFFALGGEDGEFHAANTEMVDGEVMVWCEQVSAPKKVRFGWSPTARMNLLSAEGLPAVAFRADLK